MKRNKEAVYNEINELVLNFAEIMNNTTDDEYQYNELTSSWKVIWFLERCEVISHKESKYVHSALKTMYSNITGILA